MDAAAFQAKLQALEALVDTNSPLQNSSKLSAIDSSDEDIHEPQSHPKSSSHQRKALDSDDECSNPTEPIKFIDADDNSNSTESKKEKELSKRNSTYLSGSDDERSTNFDSESLNTSTRKGKERSLPPEDAWKKAFLDSGDESEPENQPPPKSPSGEKRRSISPVLKKTNADEEKVQKTGKVQKQRKPNPIRESKNKALEEIKLHQETQRLIRESKLALPRHVPKKVSLGHFMSVFGITDYPVRPEPKPVETVEIENPKPAASENPRPGQESAETVSTGVESDSPIDQLSNQTETSSSVEERQQEGPQMAQASAENSALPDIIPVLIPEKESEETGSLETKHIDASLQPTEPPESSNIQQIHTAISAELKSIPNSENVDICLNRSTVSKPIETVISPTRFALAQPSNPPAIKLADPFNPNDPVYRLKQRFLKHARPRKATAKEPEVLHLHITRHDSATGELQLKDEELRVPKEDAVDLEERLKVISKPGAKLPLLKAKLEAEIVQKKEEEIRKMREAQKKEEEKARALQAEEEEQEFADDEMEGEYSSDSSDDDDEEEEKEETEKNPMIDGEAEEDGDEESGAGEPMDEDSNMSAPKSEVEEVDEDLRKAAANDDDEIFDDIPAISSERVDMNATLVNVHQTEQFNTGNKMAAEDDDDLLALLSCPPAAFCLKDDSTAEMPTTQVLIPSEQPVVQKSNEDEDDGAPVAAPTNRKNRVLLEEDEELPESTLPKKIISTDINDSDSELDDGETNNESEEEAEEEELECLPSDDEERNYLHFESSSPPPKVKDFFDEEAELSDEENFQASDDERDDEEMDQFDKELIDDKFKMSAKQMRKEQAELEKLNNEMMLEKDQVELDELKAILDMDDDLDGIEKLTRNVFQAAKYNVVGKVCYSSDEEEEEDSATVATVDWRVERLERERHLAEMMKSGELLKVLESQSQKFEENTFGDLCNKAVKRGLPADISFNAPPEGSQNSHNSSQNLGPPPQKKQKSFLFDNKDMRSRIASVVATNEAKKPAAVMHNTATVKPPLRKPISLAGSAPSLPQTRPKPALPSVKPQRSVFASYGAYM